MRAASPERRGSLESLSLSLGRAGRLCRLGGLGRERAATGGRQWPAGSLRQLGVAAGRSGCGLAVPRVATWGVGACRVAGGEVGE